MAQGMSHPVDVVWPMARFAPRQKAAASVAAPPLARRPPAADMPSPWRRPRRPCNAELEMHSPNAPAADMPSPPQLPPWKLLNGILNNPFIEGENSIRDKLFYFCGDMGQWAHSKAGKSGGRPEHQYSFGIRQHFAKLWLERNASETGIFIYVGREARPRPRPAALPGGRLAQWGACPPPPPYRLLAAVLPRDKHGSDMATCAPCWLFCRGGRLRGPFLPPAPQIVRSLAPVGRSTGRTWPPRCSAGCFRGTGGAAAS